MAALGGANRRTYSPNALDSLSGPADDVCQPPHCGAPVMDIVVWLRSLGLGKYEAAFRENEIDETILPNLTVFQGPPAVVNQGATAE